MNRDRPYQKNMFPILLSTLCLTTACASLGGSKHDATIQEQQKNIAALEASLQSMNLQMADLQEDNLVSKRTIASLKNDVSALIEQSQTNQKNIEIIRKGLRSGVFDDVPTPRAGAGTWDHMEQNVSLLPKLDSNRKLNEDPAPASANSGESILGPAQLLTKAELKKNSENYQEAIDLVSRLKSTFPYFDDGGKGNLISAECYIKTKKYDDALPSLRTFYLKYPNSAQLSQAKLFEANAYEGLGSTEKASALYAEVVALSPESPFAQLAKEGMLRIRDNE